MYIEVPREPLDIRPETFIERYYTANKPVILENVTRGWKTEKLTKEFLDELLNVPSDDVIRTRLWWDVSEKILEEYYIEPLFLKYIKQNRKVSVRGHPIRIWISNTGNVTHWHYDGNGLDVFNVQVNGAKSWQLVSPETPLEPLRFGAVSRRWKTPLTEEDKSKLIWSEFEQNPGDMLFLPRNWHHRVETLTPAVNLNWVWTDHASGVRNQTADREAEILSSVLYPAKLLEFFPSLVPGRLKSVFKRAKSYGGLDNYEFARQSWKRTPLLRTMLRPFRELPRERTRDFWMRHSSGPPKVD